MSVTGRWTFYKDKIKFLWEFAKIGDVGLILSELALTYRAYREAEDMFNNLGPEEQQQFINKAIGQLPEEHQALVDRVK